MQVSKLNLSKQEAEAVVDRDFFLLKHSITGKIIDLFGEMESEFKSRFSHFNIDYDGLNFSAGKIFRGENYQLYPYIMLDYPRLFSTETIFAFRTMFWWGHEFSFTLHLQGRAFEKYSEVIFASLDKLKGKQVYYCVNETPWQYDFSGKNYQLLDQSISKEEFFKKPFMKLSRRIGADQFEMAAEYGFETFELFFDMLKSR